MPIQRGYVKPSSSSPQYPLAIRFHPSTAMDPCTATISGADASVASSTEKYTVNLAAAGTYKVSIKVGTQCAWADPSSHYVAPVPPDKDFANPFSSPSSC